METESVKPRKRRPSWLLVALVALGGLVAVFVVRRVGDVTVAPLVEELRRNGYECEPMKSSDDGILRSFSACENGEVRFELSTQPTGQAHDEFVRFSIEGAGCSLARSRNHASFTLYTAKHTVVYEFGERHRFAELFEEFEARDIECKQPTI